jgi:hypothetical protein
MHASLVEYVPDKECFQLPSQDSFQKERLDNVHIILQRKRILVYSIKIPLIYGCTNVFDLEVQIMDMDMIHLIAERGVQQQRRIPEATSTISNVETKTIFESLCSSTKIPNRGPFLGCSLKEITLPRGQILQQTHPNLSEGFK